MARTPVKYFPYRLMDTWAALLSSYGLVVLYMNHMYLKALGFTKMS